MRARKLRNNILQEYKTARSRRRMAKLYTIVLNSTQGTIEGDIRNVAFSFDWNQIPDKDYIIRMQFVTALFTTTNTYALNILTDIGQLNTLVAKSPGATASSQALYRYLGTARYSGTGANNWLWADAALNVPSMIRGRPRNNIFNVYLTNNDATNSPYSSTNLPANYTLILCLEEMD